MDDVDNATEFTLRSTQAAIDKARVESKATRRLGVCNFCRNQIAADLAFCDKDCRDDAEREQKLRARQGMTSRSRVSHE